jgi:HlyD family secretion protein
MTIKQLVETNSMIMKNKLLYYLLFPVAGILSCKQTEHKFDASGAFEAVETIISAEANGQILQLNIVEGQQLDSGQIIGYIDSAQLHVSKQQLLQNKKAILTGRPQTNIQTESLKRQLANAVLDRNRTENLVKGGVASQKQLDDASAKVATIEAQIDAQENTLQTTTHSLNEQGTTLDVQLRGINDQLQKTVIVNPLKGMVLTKYAEQYEMAVMGKPLYKISDISTIILRAFITGDQLQQVKTGQQVKVFTDDGNGSFKERSGEIIWINDKSEFTPKTIQTKNERANLVYAIKVNVKNDGYLKIGMYGEVTWTK